MSREICNCLFITSGHNVQKWKGNKMESMRDTKRIMGKGQILRSTPNTAPLICGACNTQPEGLSTMA